MTDTVKLELSGAVAVLRLHRPEVHNVVNLAVMERLEQVLDDLEASDARVVILTGTGKSFCAGGDLSYFSDLDNPGDGVAMSRRMQAILRRLEDGPRPVIAALNGPVIGGGCEIAVACHLRIAAAGIRFGFRPAALGLITGWGGGRRLFRLLGRGAALRLLLGAETLQVDEALTLGLVDQIVAAEQLMDEALAWAERIAANVPASLRAILELDRCIRSSGAAEVIETETRLFGELWNGPDFKQSLNAWQLKRAQRDV